MGFFVPRWLTTGKFPPDCGDGDRRVVSRLPLPELEKFEDSGVYYAATDMEAKYCRDTDAVIGGR